MLANLQHVLRQAQRGRYAVGAFNVSDLEQAQAVVQAAVALRSPVIVNTSEKAIEYAGLEEIAALVQAMAKKFPVPIVLNLDHGRHVPLARACLKAGYSGIMFDGGRLPYEQNVERTSAVVRAARTFGVGVEGEVGQVKYPEDWKKANGLIMTNPHEAADFVRRTGVAAFAPAVGNSHGLPRPGERIHFDLLANIRKVVKVPLVLHGASGMTPGALQKAIHLGICKINIDTDLRLAFSAALKKELRQEPKAYDPRQILLPARSAVMEIVKKKMIIFGSKGKA